MNHNQMIELLGAYAIDAVDESERAEIDRHLDECAICRAEVREHFEAASFLAETGATAPPAAWDRIAEAVAAPPIPDIADARRRRSSRVAVASLAAAAAIVVVVAAVGLQVREQDDRIDELQTALRDPMAPAFADALDDPASRVFELSSPDRQVTVRGVVTADGVGYLRATSLPAVAGDRTYQLWGATGQEFVSLGLLGRDPGVISFRATSYASLAITEERAAGAVAPTRAPLVAGRITSA